MTKRILIFIAGVVAYAIFLATFVYAIGFVGNIAVPTALDAEPSGPPLTALAIDLGLLALFAVQHSLMARRWWKVRLTRVVPQPLERSAYVVFSSLAMILLFWQWRPIGGVVWSVETPWLRAALYGLFAFGFGLVLVATFLINHFDLFGLRQVWLALRGVPYQPLRFGTPGPYKLVRHPLYVGWLFAFWATPHMTVAHLVFAVMTTAYILVAIRFEERDLVRDHGASYEEYRRRTPMLVPSLRPRRAAVAEPGEVRAEA
jgi:methanethiol S-methyltransferase